MVDIDITPEPSEAERKAILTALELEEQERASRDGAAAEQPWGDPGVVEP